MKKIFLILLIFLMLLNAQVFATEVSFKVGEEDININGNLIKTAKSIERGGTTLVPLRIISEAFGANVVWDDISRKIIISKDDVEIILQIDNIVATINGAEKELLLAPVLIDDTTMVPIRFISENFDANVTYDDRTSEIKVIKEDSNKYRNSNLKYSLIVLDGWSVDDSKFDSVRFSKGDSHFNINVYKSDAFKDLATYSKEFKEDVSEYSSRELSITNSSSIISGNLSEYVNCTYLRDDISHNDAYIVFTNGIYLYEIYCYLEGEQLNNLKTEFNTMVDSLKCEHITENINNLTIKDSLEKVFNDTTKLNIELPFGWTINSDNENSIISGNGFKIEFQPTDSEVYIAPERKAFERNNPLTEFSTKGNDLYLFKFYNDQFTKYCGIKEKYSVNPNKPGFEIIDKPYADKSFVDDTVYVFYADGDPNTKNVDKEKKYLCFVFAKDAMFYVAKCDVNKAYKIGYNRTVYSKIIKNILK